MSFTFYLGTHETSWLGRTDVPLFLSHRRLMVRAGLPRARGPWALDSGGFTELSLHGRWTIRPAEYVAAIRRYLDDVGGMQWAAPQDWMCEPEVTAKTGLTIHDHQLRTVENFLELKSRAPELPIIPVLQAWWGPGAAGDARYDDHAELYLKHGVDLGTYPLVGVGSVCRKQRAGLAFMLAVQRQLEPLADRGVRFHGFGMKTEGLHSAPPGLFSSTDSLAWSYNARRNRPRHDCQHRRCSNCLPFALDWRQELLDGLPRVPE